MIRLKFADTILLKTWQLKEMRLSFPCWFYVFFTKSTSLRTTVSDHAFVLMCITVLTLPERPRPYPLTVLPNAQLCLKDVRFVIFTTYSTGNWAMLANHLSLTLLLTTAFLKSNFLARWTFVLVSKIGVIFTRKFDRRIRWFAR